MKYKIKGLRDANDQKHDRNESHGAIRTNGRCAVCSVSTANIQKTSDCKRRMRAQKRFGSSWTSKPSKTGKSPKYLKVVYELTIKLCAPHVKPLMIKLNAMPKLNVRIHCYTPFNLTFAIDTIICASETFVHRTLWCGTVIHFRRLPQICSNRLPAASSKWTRRKSKTETPLSRNPQ